MTLRTLEHFQALADYASFTKAAKTLFISQSALSHSIQGLEQELGVRLFERKGSQVRLTEQGERLLFYAKRIFLEQENLRLALGDRRAPFRDPIAITIKMGFYPQRALLRSFQQKYPQARLAVYQHEQGRMEHFPWDLSVFNRDTPQKQPNAQLLFTEPFLLLLHKEHPLQKSRVITPADLARWPGLQMMLSSSVMEHIDACFAAAGAHPQYVVSTDHFHLVIHMLHEKRCWAILPARSMVPSPLGELCLRRVQGLELRRWVYLGQNPDRYPRQAVRLFRQFAAEYFSQGEDALPYEL